VLHCEISTALTAAAGQKLRLRSCRDRRQISAVLPNRMPMLGQTLVSPRWDPPNFLGAGRAFVRRRNF
jgi:hypothetical protein